LPHHYTKDTTEAPYWCEKCFRITQHSVSGGRLGRCKEHEFAGVAGTGLTRVQFKRKQQQEKEQRQPRLF